MEQFKSFKKNVPVMGGILLDKSMQRVLLVKGWKNTACWGFPRGKIHKNETDAQCAVREVGCYLKSAHKAISMESSAASSHHLCYRPLPVQCRLPASDTARHIVAMCVFALQVLEETGYDIEALVNEDDFIELTLEGKRNKLYIVAGLDPDSAQFAPKCKGVSNFTLGCSRSINPPCMLLVPA